MNCPSCGAPLRMAAGNATLRCDYCGTVVVVKPGDSGLLFLDQVPTQLNCPVCSVPLWNASVSGVALRACKRCSGMLVSMGVFEALIEKRRAESTGDAIPSPPDPADLNRRLNCPQCRKPLDMHFYCGGGSSVIGGCENCSLNWLDGGVLIRIVRAPHAGESDNDY
jgi:LSD1 subclass zinc finger protein